jgi:hypothetical protein
MLDATVKTGGHYTLKIVHDDDSINPREDYDNFGKMVCWHSRYNLGDKHDYRNPDDFLAELVRGSLPEKDIIAYVKDGNAGNLKLEYTKATHEWDLSSYDDYFKKWYEVESYPAPLEKESAYVCDGILENMSSKDLMALAERQNLVLPLYLLDHSGITISTSDFRDKWDSGQVGWTYASKADITKEYGDNSPESLERAERLLKAEVESYDCYIRGECYGFQLFEDGVETDSCWGFLGSFNEALKAIREYLPEDAVPLADSAEYGDDEPEYDPEDENDDMEMEGDD